MNVACSAFCLAKEGNAVEECEDAYFAKCPSPADGWLASFAIADGATESMLSGQWASILVRQFCRRGGGSPTIDEQLLREAHDVWRRWKRFYLLGRAAQGRPIQWYEEPGLEAGAFSTLTGLTLLKDPCIWVATAVGDSCLFQVRGGRLGAAIPIRDSLDFGNRPPLICSEPLRNQSILDEADQATGDLRTGDEFYLLTDALASWFLREYEADVHPWADLAALASSGDASTFEAWVTDLRGEARLRNDDVALLRVIID